MLEISLHTSNLEPTRCWASILDVLLEVHHSTINLLHVPTLAAEVVTF